MIKSTAIFVVLFTNVIALVLYKTHGYEMALSCLLGGFIMLFNLLGIFLLWHLVFSKKSIALAVLVIIFKYLILGLVLWNLSSIVWVKPLGLVAGLSTLVAAILCATIAKGFAKTNNS